MVSAQVIHIHLVLQLYIEPSIYWYLTSIFDPSLLRDNMGVEIPLMLSSEDSQVKNSIILLALSLVFRVYPLNYHCQFFSSGVLPLTHLE